MLKNKQILMICVFLTIATLVVFWQVNNYDFINYDDLKYVTENHHTLQGISMNNIRWAFTTGYFANWHPLTWISHMLDVQLFGLKPRWHHLTNLLFHVANTLLLFFVLNRMTKARWESAFVAALFALHPLHVESVAWVAERKDVLSTFFWILTMGAYCRYVERRGLQRYLLVVLFFALGLMSKPMLVTLPFVLLLLDYWPLQRFRQIPSDQKIGPAVHGGTQTGRSKKKKMRHTAGEEGKAERPAGSRYQWALIHPLIWEKIPLFALTVLSSIVTYLVQQEGGAVSSFETNPLSFRIANAFVSYFIYIGKTVLPNGLAVLYPYPPALPVWQVFGAVLLLTAITITVVWKAERTPYLAMGWLWYLGTLVPVIGIVKIGYQARADHYTYIPLIGLFIMAAWGISELSNKWRYRKEILFTSSIAIFLCLCLVTWTQVRHWQNSITLFDHALNVTDNNYVAYYNRGIAYANLRNDRQAIEDYDKALEISPEFAMAYDNRGISHANLGNLQQAIGDYTRAMKINPNYAGSYYNRGNASLRLGNHRQAIEDYDKALEINPKYAEAHDSRANAYVLLGNYRQAIEDYDKAVEINPNYAEAYNNRGTAHANLGNYRRAIEDYDKVIEIDPKEAEAYNNRGIAYSRLGNTMQAIEDLKTAARLGYTNAQNTLKSRGIEW